MIITGNFNVKCEEWHSDFNTLREMVVQLKLVPS